MRWPPMLSKVLSRLTLGAVAYWSANAVLLASEAKWHLVYRLLALDVRAAEAIPPLIVSKLLGSAIGIAFSTT